MGKTVTMQKGDVFADIYDSEETIAQAQKDGYHVCSEAEMKVREERAIAKKPKNDNNSSKGNGNTQTKTNLADMNKTALLAFAGKKKLYDKSFKEKKPAEIIPVILEKARAKIVEAELKTADEAAALTEDELFTLFDSINPEG